jgi:hypothetical protein
VLTRAGSLPIRATHGTCARAAAPCGRLCSARFKYAPLPPIAHVRNECLLEGLDQQLKLLLGQAGEVQNLVRSPQARLDLQATSGAADADVGQLDLGFCL